MCASAHGCASAREAPAWGRSRAGDIERIFPICTEGASDSASFDEVLELLHLAAVPTFATRWLIPRLPDLKAQQPDLTVHIETRTRPFMFADTPLDAALFAGTPEQVSQWAGTQAIKLLDEMVLPVCAPSLLQGAAGLQPESVAQLPLLQQSTRPLAWRQWFEAQGVTAPQALAGPRFEQFSMTAAAAVHGMGMALAPRLLIEDELQRGDLVVACDRAMASQRAYYLVRPDGADAPHVATVFQNWLMQASVGR